MSQLQTASSSWTGGRCGLQGSYGGGAGRSAPTFGPLWDRDGLASVPAAERYVQMAYRRARHGGLLLLTISFSLWQNSGTERPFESSRAIVRRAFDLGITHLDLANNEAPPRLACVRTEPRVVADTSPCSPSV